MTHDGPAEKAIRTTFVPGSSVTPHALEGGGFVGATETLLIGAEHSSVHQEVVLMELAPGGVIPGHFHPFEESFVVMAGSAFYGIDGQSYEVKPGDFGFAPIGTPHAWRNDSSEPVRWLEMRVPQPKEIGRARGIYAAPDTEPPRSGRPIVVGDPTARFVSHYDAADVPPYGPIVGNGTLNYAVKHISVRYLVTEVMGAAQHVSFVAQLPPAPISSDSVRDLMETDPSTKYHFHQYEEVYHFLEGRGLAFLDGRTFEVHAGDTILAAVGGSHSVINISDEPLSWIESQAPIPPQQYSMFWEKEWLALDPLAVSARPIGGK